MKRGLKSQEKLGPAWTVYRRTPYSEKSGDFLLKNVTMANYTSGFDLLEDI